VVYIALFSLVGGQLAVINNVVPVAFAALPSPSATPVPSPVPCGDDVTVFGVSDAGGRDSQFFALDRHSGAVTNIGPLRAGLNAEGLEMHPANGLLYVATSEPSTQARALFVLNRYDGSLTLVGRVGFDVEALALTKRCGYRIKEIPVQWVNDTRSLVGVSAYIQTLIETLKIWWWLKVNAYDLPKR